MNRFWLYPALAALLSGCASTAYNKHLDEAYKAYAARATAAAAKYGGIYLARGGQTVPAEGSPPAPRAHRLPRRCAIWPP